MRDLSTQRVISRVPGTSLVEFAFVLPLLALLLFAIIQYGFIFNAYMTLRHGCHVAARSVSLAGASTNNVTAIVCQTIQPLLSCSRLGPVIPTPTTVGGISAMNVTATYSLPLIIKFVVPGASSNNLTVTAQATYRSN